MNARPTSGGTGTSSTPWMSILSERRPTEARSKSILGVRTRSARRGRRCPAFVLDDDHEYNPACRGGYSKALRASPSTVFTVQSPPSQLNFRPRFPVAYGSRGVGIRLDLALDGALAAYAAMASRLEPTCRVVDDIVVSAFLAARGITVKDVPGFSFRNRPWQSNRQIHALSKKKQLRSSDRDAQNGRCHDALVRRNWRAAAPRRRAVQKRAASAHRGGPGRLPLLPVFGSGKIEPSPESLVWTPFPWRPPPVHTRPFLLT